LRLDLRTLNFIGFTGLPNIVALNHWQVGEKNPQFALISKIILSIYNVMKLSLRRCFFAPKNPAQDHDFQIQNVHFRNASRV